MVELSSTEHTVGWTGRQARDTVYARQGGLCALCWEPVALDVMEAHHRRRRATMPPESLWCCCDVVGLHARCHTQGARNRWQDPMPRGSWAVHDFPSMAVLLGLTVWFGEPADVPVAVEWPWLGTGLLDHNGDLVSTL